VLDLTVAEYFAGIGLVRMGLESSGWRVVFANDISPKKYAMYQDFFPEGKSHYQIANIFDLQSDAIPSTLLATCSFPCVDLSLAGKMGGIHGTHSSAFWGFINILEAHGAAAPPIVLLENVTGWLYSNHGQDFRLTVEALNQLGYTCDVFTLDALHFTPQSRPRVFLIGTRNHDNDDALQHILMRPKALLSERLRQNLLVNDDLHWNYVALPHPPALVTSGLHLVIENLSTSDKRWWSTVEVERHLSMMTPLHRQRIELLATQQRLTYRTFYRRIRDGLQRAEVRDDDVAGCLRTAAGGSGKQFLVQAGFGHIQMRVMTPREYARLQGVPDDFVIGVSTNQALNGFGDAVCVPAIQWIAKNVLAKLVETEYTLPVFA